MPGGIGNIFQKAASLFVETTPSSNTQVMEIDPKQRVAAMKEIQESMTAPRKTVAQVVEEAPGPNLDQIGIDAEKAQSAKVLGPDNKVDYPALYAAAGVPAATFTAEQVLQMLSSLPATLDLATKRQMVRVSLDALGHNMGVSTETIVADASRKLAAIASFAKQHQETTDQYVSAATEAITRLEQQIAERKKGIEDAQARLSTVLADCAKQTDYLDDTLEIFTLDVAPSRYAPPAEG
jgi:hypothetical protein